MKKKVALYIRVSTDAQFEEGYSVDAQKEMLAAYCTTKGWKDYEFYIDGGFSGSNIERPAMQRLIDDVKQGVISAVVVYKLDRLSRSQKDTLYLIEDVFNPAGAAFTSLNENLDTATPMGRAMLLRARASVAINSATMKDCCQRASSIMSAISTMKADIAIPSASCIRKTAISTTRRIITRPSNSSTRKEARNHEQNLYSQGL